MQNNNEKKDNLAAIGIGAMIVFIALILVAAVAAAVIIQTAEKLQQNAQSTGDDTTDEMSGKVLIGKLNVDENSQTPPKYGIRGIPTLMLFKKGEPVGTQVGAISKNDLKKFIEDNI